MLSPHLILPVKTRIVLKSLNEVCKQTAFRNVKQDNDCRENTAIESEVSSLRLDITQLFQVLSGLVIKAVKYCLITEKVYFIEF